MIQATSQFNYLEMPNPHATPSFGLSYHYMCDPTVQGPRCATATPGSTWLRNWVLTTGDAENRQFNGLRAVLEELDAEERFVSMQNGYCLLHDSAPKTCIDGEGLEKLVEERMKMGISIDAEVLTVDRPETAPADGRGYVANAWCSAVPWVQDDQRPLLELGKAVLKASYKATLLGAIAHQMDVVYLTSVGGGVWGNSEEMIAEAIQGAIDEAGKCQRSLEVVILHFRRIGRLADLVLADVVEDPVDPV